jgi:hypothetical protein
MGGNTAFKLVLLVRLTEAGQILTRRQEIGLRKQRLSAYVNHRSRKTYVETNHTTDLRLRLLSRTKREISLNGHANEARPIGRAPKRSVEGIPVPVLGRE